MKNPHILGPLRVLAALGVVACGGDGATAPKVPPRPTAQTALALGSRVTCALTDSGKAYCWGDDLSGQIGDSTFVPKNVPTAVAGQHTYVAIAAGDQTVCAIDTGGAPWCWGDDPTQPGVRQSFRNLPVAVATSRPFVSLTVGHKFACALDDGGTAYCWGENGRGQLAQTDTLGRPAASRISGSVRFTTLAAGFWSVCGLSTDQSVYCWGDNSYGELATGDTLAATGLHKVSGTATFKFLTSGSIHSCGIATNGHTLCWGANFSGQLGDGTNSRRLVPSEAAPGLTFVSLSAERANSIFAHTCGLTGAGEVYCWGWNSKSQLGSTVPADACVTGNATLTFVCAHDPVKVAGISGVSRIDAGLEHTCAIVGTTVYCWGDNTYGALGDGSGVSTSQPVVVKGGLIVP